MPMQSKAQNAYMWAEHPSIAERWRKEFPHQDIKHLPEYKHMSKDKSSEPHKVSGANESKAHSAIHDKAADVGEHQLDTSGAYDHIHDFADGLSDHELLYAHKHIGAKLDSSGAGKMRQNKDLEPAISMDDFEKAKKED